MTYAHEARGFLLPLGAKVRILLLPGLPPKGDIVEWLEAHDSAEPDALRAQIIALAGRIEPEKLLTQIEPAHAVKGFNLTDVGNGERFAARHGDKVRYCWTWGKWYYFDGTAWNGVVGEAQASTLAVETVRAIAQEAEDADKELRKALLQWSCSSESCTRIRNMLALARDKSPVAAYADDFDTKGFLFNVLNLTIRFGDSPDDCPTP